MFKGVFAPIPTPFIQGEIAYNKLKNNLNKWEKTDLSGLVVLGSNGEFVYLTHHEKEKLVAFVRENYPKEKPVIAGTGCESTQETITLTKQAALAGADAALILNPSYYKGGMTDEALYRHYCAVADASPIPIMVYNMPRNTGLNLSSSLVSRLSAHQNIVGVKDSSGNIVQIQEIIRDTDRSFAVFAGSASFLFPALIVGGVGGTLALANILPNECACVCKLAWQGELEAARKLQMQLLKINHAVTAGWGMAGLKAAMDMLGYYGGETRSPLLPLGEIEKEKLRMFLIEVGALS